MVASVLNTPRAMEVSVYVVRAFVKLREMLGAHKELEGKLAELESRVEAHDEHITAFLEAIRQLRPAQGFSQPRANQPPHERAARTHLPTFALGISRLRKAQKCTGYRLAVCTPVLLAVK